MNFKNSKKEKGNNNAYYTVGNSPFIYAGYTCNNNCIFCFEADRIFKKKSTEELKKEIKIIRKKFNFINIMGREPTLRNDIIELIRYAKSLNFKQIGITTNGRMFAYSNFAKEILQSGLNQIGMTLTSSNSKIHDVHTLVKGSFNQTLTGLKNILFFKNKDLSLLINIMVTQLNYAKLIEIVDFYNKLGIKEINIGHILPLNKKIKNSKKIVAPMYKVVPFLTEIQKKFGHKIKFLFVEYPACVFPENFRHMSFPCLEENPQKIRIKLCKECDYTGKCTGIDKDYINLYGEKEFKL